MHRCRSFICMLLTSCSSIPFVARQRPSYISAKHTSPPTTNTSTKVVQNSHFNNNSSQPRYFQYRANRLMTFSYMVYMLSTCEGYFSIILGAIHCEWFRLAEMHKLSLTDADLRVLSQVSLYVPGLHLE